MLDALLEHPFFLNRHRQAPLLKERESFLDQLQKQGTSRKALRNLSGQLLNVVRLLHLSEMRDVSLEEIIHAARSWSRQQRANPRAHSYGNSASSFIYAAKKWLRFHGRLKLPSAAPIRFADQLSDFARYMTDEKGLSPHSVRSHCSKTSKFLEWFGERHRLLARVRLEDVDEFLAMKGAGGWKRRSVGVTADALRAFFRYAETREWCAAGLAKGIQGPRIYKYEGLPEGPSWEEVCKLLRSVNGSRLADLRARAVLSLLAVYGLRSSEVSQLMLSDFDWREEVFEVNHSKRGRRQRYPLRREVGDAVLQAANKIAYLVKKGWSTTISPDGPYGPPRILKKRVLHIALQSGVPIVPLTISSSRFIPLPSWDSKKLPLPFNRIKVVVHEPIYIDRQDLSEASARIVSALGRRTVLK
jgi:integrase/recombinase XerD